MNEYMLAKKTVEINPNHGVMKEMLSKIKESDSESLDEQTKDLATVLYNMALLNSGFEITNPNDFT